MLICEMSSANKEGIMIANKTNPTPSLVAAPEEVARLLGMSRAYIWQMIKSGEIQSTSFGRMRRIPRTEIDRLLAEGIGQRRPLAKGMKKASAR